MTKLQRDFRVVGQELLRLFQQNHYTEWTSAFANLTAESLAEAMTFKEFVEVNRAGAVSLVWQHPTWLSTASERSHISLSQAADIIEALQEMAEEEGVLPYAQDSVVRFGSGRYEHDSIAYRLNLFSRWQRNRGARHVLPKLPPLHSSI
jgi:hypothetical protein